MGKVRQVHFMAVLAALFALWGCSKPSEPESVVAEPSPVSADSAKSVKAIVKSAKVTSTYAALSDNAIIIAVDGTVLTKKEFDKWIDLRLAMVKRSLKKEQTVDNSYREVIRDAMLHSVTNDFKREVVLKTYAKVQGFKVSSNAVKRCQDGFRAASKSRSRKWEKVLAGFDASLRPVIEGRVNAEATMLSVKEKWFSDNPVKMAKGETDKPYRQYLEYNQTCIASNAFTWAQASNVWKKAESGVDFGELQARYDEDEYKDGSGVWGEYKVSDFQDDPELWRLSRNFRPGYVSPPVESDNGLVIIKINLVDDGGADASAPGYVPSPDAEFNISRIFFHLPLFMESVDRARFDAEYKTAKENDEFRKFFESLAVKAKVEFPSGVEIFNPQPKGGLGTTSIMP